MSSYGSMPLVSELNRLAFGSPPAEKMRWLDERAAANRWASTSGLGLIAALNSKAGLAGRYYIQDLNGICNYIAGTTGLEAREALSRVPGTLTDPTTISDNSVWFDASNISGATDGAALSTWQDRSGNSRDATQSGSLRPVFRSTGSNLPPTGRPFVQFDGTDDRMDFPFPTFTNKTTFAVAVNIGGATNDGICSTGTYYNIRYDNPATTIRFEATKGDNTTHNVTAGTVTTGTWSLITMRVEDGNIIGRINGVQVGTATSTTGGKQLTGASGGNLGQDTGADPLNGGIAEVITYDRALGTAEIQAIEQYLTSKYGIGLPTGMAAWWDASRISGVTDGAGVSAWSDQTVNARNLTQGTGSLQPLYRASTSSFNNRPTVEFDGTDDKLAGTFPAMALSSFFSVALRSGGAQGGAVIEPASASRLLLPRLETNGTSALFNRGTNGTTSVTTSTAHVYTALNDTANTTYGADGTVVTNSSPGTNTVASGTVGVGANSVGTGDYLQGHIAEVIVYNRLLNTTERQTVEAYLKAKYGTP